jgi:hypothetical protein
LQSSSGPNLTPRTAMSAGLLPDSYPATNLQKRTLIRSPPARARRALRGPWQWIPSRGSRGQGDPSPRTSPRPVRAGQAKVRSAVHRSGRPAVFSAPGVEPSLDHARTAAPAGCRPTRFATLWKSPRRSDRCCARHELRRGFRSRTCRENVPAQDQSRSPFCSTTCAGRLAALRQTRIGSKRSASPSR